MRERPAMLEGFVPWPEADAARWRALGLWEGLTVAGMFDRSAARAPGHAALVSGAQRLGYAELGARSKRIALRLLALGLTRGQRVVVQLPNGIEFALLYLALQRIGAIPVMALRAHRQAELRHFVGASGASAYVVADRVGSFDYRPMAAALAGEFAHLRHVIVAGEPAPGQVAWSVLDDGLCGPVGAAEDAALAAARPDPGDVCTMLLSGGTTAMSKLIPRTHDDYVLNARLCAQAAGFDAATVWLGLLPLGHNYNLASPGLLGTWHAGGTAVIGTGTDAADVFATVARERVTVIAAVVPLVVQWLASDAPAAHDLSSLKVVQNGGARLAPALRARLRERWRCVPQEIYGTAEGLINMTRLDDSDALLLQSSGAPVSEHDEIRVVDDEGRELPDGEPGELLTRGPYTIRGYYAAPQKNAEAFTADGFYRMGDIVRKRGRHVFTEGRRKDLINRGGEKISCDEVENLVFAHPDVQAVALVGLPDAAFGERACACVVPRPGRSLTLEALVAFLRERQIASFKLPERLELFEAFPLSPVGKILKRALKEQVLERDRAGSERR